MTTSKQLENLDDVYGVDHVVVFDLASAFETHVTVSFEKGIAEPTYLSSRLVSFLFRFQNLILRYSQSSVYRFLICALIFLEIF